MSKQEKVEWTLTGPKGADVEPIDYIPLKRAGKDAPDSERELIESHNTMVSYLRDNKLMKEKE